MDMAQIHSVLLVLLCQLAKTVFGIHTIQHSYFLSSVEIKVNGCCLITLSFRNLLYCIRPMHIQMKKLYKSNRLAYSHR